MLTKQDLNSIKEVVKNEVRTELVPVHKDINNIGRDIKKLRADLNTTINFFNKEDLSTRNILNKTRNELGLNEVVFTN